MNKPVPVAIVVRPDGRRAAFPLRADQPRSLSGLLADLLRRLFDPR